MESLLAQTDCTQKLLREELGGLLRYLHHQKRHLKKLGSHCRLEGYSTSYHLQEGRQMKLWQLQQDLISPHNRKSICLHATQQIFNLSGGFPTWGTTWVLCKPRNYGHDLLVTNRVEMHWTESAPLHDICWLDKPLKL